MKKDLLKLLDLTREDITEILDTADQMKYSQKHGIAHDYLKGKTLAMIFEKNSTRTRVSFEVGMYQLGGHALFLSGKESQIGRGEPVEDTARVLSRYCDGIMIRTYAQKEVEDLAKYASIPVINGLTDFCHPCQVLADLMTVREKQTRLEGLKLAFIGDGNNMANSLIVGGLKCGMDVSVACPEGYDPDPEVLAFAKTVTDVKFELCRAPADAVKDATWWSPTCGHPWGRRRRRPSVRRLSPVTAWMRSSWSWPIPAAWCSTACPPTGVRRSARVCSRPTPTRSLRRPRTGSTPRRRSCTC